VCVFVCVFECVGGGGLREMGDFECGFAICGNLRHELEKPLST
jgi:hypothetical protein